MTPQQKLQCIKEYFWKLNPEIKELKFGCRFLDNKNVLHTILGKEDSDFYCLSEEHFSMVIIGVDYVRGRRVKETGSKPEILGRPILIDDVMLVMGKKSEYVIGLDGHFLKPFHGAYNELGISCYEGTGIYWNPTKDLDHNPQTWDLIFDSICEK